MAADRREIGPEVVVVKVSRPEPEDLRQFLDRVDWTFCHPVHAVDPYPADQDI